MKEIEFTKMVAAGNDFVVFYDSLKLSTARIRSLARKICDRKYGIGADGLLLLSKSKTANVRMRIFNADGSEAEMCGNGARCAALDAAGGKKKIRLETIAGIIHCEVNNNNNNNNNNVRIKLTDPKDIRLDLPLTLNKRAIKVNFIDTGVPHAVVLVEGLDLIDVKSIGKSLRFHKKFAPRGTNVDFVQIIDKGNIAVRTYERGVEDETCACGTGSAASAIIAGIKLSDYRLKTAKKIKVHTKSGAILTVYFKTLHGAIQDVWLAGRAEIVYSGKIEWRRYDI